MWRLTRPLDRTKPEAAELGSVGLLTNLPPFASTLTVLPILPGDFAVEETQGARESFELKERGDVDRLLPAFPD
ncbi:MAG: hypothetical protein J6K20_02770 [Thermoguttaceae bacterium]|nr:hypothetical protein [Thermoguttaceae bacterium]